MSGWWWLCTATRLIFRARPICGRALFYRFRLRWSLNCPICQKSAHRLRRQPLIATSRQSSFAGLQTFIGVNGEAVLRIGFKQLCSPKETNRMKYRASLSARQWIYRIDASHSATVTQLYLDVYRTGNCSCSRWSRDDRGSKGCNSGIVAPLVWEVGYVSWSNAYICKFNLIAKFCRSYKIVIKVTHKSYIYPPEETALTVHSHQGNWRCVSP